MAKNFYAVKQGRIPGIYTSWEECKEQVHGYPDAAYKGFATREEALAFINGGQLPDTAEDDGTVSTLGCAALAYTDGSFDAKTNLFALGAVIFFNGEQITMNEAFEDEDLAEMRNVAGEIMAARRVMEYCMSNNIPSVEIRYDYAGVENWCTGAWKTNKEGTSDYKAFYDSIKNILTVRFTKVKGHSGNKYNDLADSLAKEALGI